VADLIPDAHQPRAVLEDRVGTAELLQEWRDATRAAELAERLARMALESADRAEEAAVTNDDIAEMANRAATYAERAARVARVAADRVAAARDRYHRRTEAAT
jgi:hypothetical protein